MTVYVVTRGEYSDYHIESIFTDKEQAVLYCATHESDYGWECPEIEEWEADERKFENNAPIKKMWKARVDVRTGNITTIDEQFTIRNVNVIEESASWCANPFYCVTVTLGKDSTREHADKAIFDRLAQWLYEKSMKEEEK